MRAAAALLLLLALPACGTISGLARICRAPGLAPVGAPTPYPTCRRAALPMPSTQPAPPDSNSLWRQGSRAFFKDQRAAQVGDIVTVLVNITDAADMKNQTSANRTGAEEMGMANFFGLESRIPKFLKDAVAANLVSVNSQGNAAGIAAIKRNETVTLRLAGVITQVLANGNLVVAARQEVRVNSELRELTVAGIIRSQDIASDNTVHHDRMAEARIAYGGRGQLSYAQSPRLGQQILDTLLPF